MLIPRPRHLHLFFEPHCLRGTFAKDHLPSYLPPAQRDHRSPHQPTQPPSAPNSGPQYGAHRPYHLSPFSVPMNTLTPDCLATSLQARQISRIDATLSRKRECEGKGHMDSRPEGIAVSTTSSKSIYNSPRCARQTQFRHFCAHIQHSISFKTLLFTDAIHVQGEANLD
jgi:hypothetical protein